MDSKILLTDSIFRYNKVSFLYRIAYLLHSNFSTNIPKYSNCYFVDYNSMVQIEVIQNTFDNSSLKKLTQILKMVNFNQPRNKIGTNLFTQLSNWMR
jgi:hypothetical protein